MNKSAAVINNTTKESHIDFKSFRIEKSVNTRSFFIVFELIFIFLVYYSWKNNISVLLWLSATIAVIIIFAYLFFPNIFLILVKSWSKLGLILHHIMQPILVGLLFFVVFTPIGLFLKLTGKNLLWLKRKDIQTMWHKPSATTNFKDQF